MVCRFLPLLNIVLLLPLLSRRFLFSWCFGCTVFPQYLNKNTCQVNVCYLLVLLDIPTHAMVAGLVWYTVGKALITGVYMGQY